MQPSRERIRNLLAGKPTDRIPNGLGGAETTGLHLLAYERLKVHLNIPGLTARTGESETHYMKRKSRSAILDVSAR